MFKFICKNPQTNERQKLQRELFGFRKTVQHGFPFRTSALAWDPVLRLLCITSANGYIKVYGQIGVEFYGQHKNSESTISKVEFINGTGKIVTLCDDNSLHLWQIDSDSRLKELKSSNFDGKSKKISTISVHSSGKSLFVGTESGNIYVLSVKSFELLNNETIYQDYVLQKLSDEYKLNPGAVEVILEKPDNSNQLLIGFNRGLLVLWNRSEKSVVNKYVSSQQLEFACWNDDGSEFISTHNDGSYTTWSSESGENPIGEPQTTYGPFPCKSITKLLQKRVGDENLKAFSGGMPRASFGDKFTVTLIHGDRHNVLDFSSKIIDFVLINGDYIVQSSNSASSSTLITSNGGAAVRQEAESEEHAATAVAADSRTGTGANTTTTTISTVDGDSSNNNTISAQDDSQNNTLNSEDSGAGVGIGIGAGDPNAQNDSLNNNNASRSSSGSNSDENRHQYHDTLLVLTEEELVAIDLESDDWNMMNLPYLVSLHASAITCSQHVSQVPEQLWKKLKEAGEKQTNSLYSKALWPISGGCIISSDERTNQGHDLLLTGHEDGSVKFWDASGITLSLIYKMTTANYFSSDEIADEGLMATEGNNAANGTGSNGHGHGHGKDSDNDEEDEWPSFKKTGIFDPYSDDPRLAIRKLILCPYTETLVVCGTSGHVLVTKFGSQPTDLRPLATLVDIVSKHDAFVWKGHDRLLTRERTITQPIGFQVQSIVQLHPPAAITACALHSEAKLVAAGTAHGLTLFDYCRQKTVLVKCTLNPNDTTAMGSVSISRRKSFKKSLRESFRRLRKGRSGRNQKTVNNTNSNQAAGNKRSAVSNQTTSAAASGPFETKPVERQIEARSHDDGMGSVVRCLYFVKTFLINMNSTVLTLWTGTYIGTVHIFTIIVPAQSKRNDENVICQLGKEIQLKHRAPVVSIMVVDAFNRPIPEPYESDNSATLTFATAGISSESNPQPHRVLIISEEQFKVFTLPSLKPFNKFKLTAYEGSRIRKVAFAKFQCDLNDTNAKHWEFCLLCLTNLGDCLVMSVPDLRRQLTTSAIRSDDISGISSLVFTKEGEAFYLNSSSEYQRLTFSAKKVTLPKCTVNVDNSNYQHKNENIDEMLSQNITATSSIGNITVDSVRDHIGSDLINQLANIALKNKNEPSAETESETTEMAAGSVAETAAASVATGTATVSRTSVAETSNTTFSNVNSLQQNSSSENITDNKPTEIN